MKCMSKLYYLTLITSHENTLSYIIISKRAIAKLNYCIPLYSRTGKITAQDC